MRNHAQFRESDSVLSTCPQRMGWWVRVAKRSEEATMNHDALVERAMESELFTAPRLAADLRTFLSTHRPVALKLAAEARERGIETVYYTGSGGSWSAIDRKSVG